MKKVIFVLFLFLETESLLIQETGCDMINYAMKNEALKQFLWHKQGKNKKKKQKCGKKSIEDG